MHLAKFERLPDEILLEICRYLRPLEVIEGFGRLNGRLDRTISQFRRNLDVHHLTLKQYQRWSAHFLPYTARDIVSLVLSNWNSPGQIYLFNQSIERYASLRQLFPSITQLRLIGFHRNDIGILSKLSMIARILIDVDALKPLLYDTECLLDRSLFCSSYSFKEIRLWLGETGLRLQSSASIVVNPALENLTIVLTCIDDLIVLFKRAPNLVKLHVHLSQSSANRPAQYVVNEAMPRKLTDLHIQTTDRRALAFDDFFVLMIHIPSIQRLSLDIETNDLDYADGLCWMFLKSRLPQLKHLYFRIRLWIGTGMMPIDIDPFLESFVRTRLPVICYADTRVLHVDTIPYVMYQAQANVSVTTSPCAKLAKATDHHLLEQRAFGVQSLCMRGRYEPTVLVDWLHVLRRFPGIRALDLTAMNIVNTAMDSEQQPPLCLSRLIALRCVRSKRCHIDLPLFLLLVKNRSVAPHLRALTVMYGDLIHLCKRLPNDTFERIQELWLLSSDTDGRVIPKDMQALLQAFSSSSHFTFFMQNSRAINRHVEEVLGLILSSLPNLISVRMICKKGSFRLHSLAQDDQRRAAWLTRVLPGNDCKELHWVIDNREISIWK